MVDNMNFFIWIMNKIFVSKTYLLKCFLVVFVFILFYENMFNKSWDYKMVEIVLHSNYSNYDNWKHHIIFSENNSVFKCCTLY